jgi:ATP-dependent DNA helicase RecG
MGKMTNTDDQRKAPRLYMEEAVRVMKDSVDEKGKENPCPRVGAVLVFPDGRTETAYRGQYRDGDHAEYTLLDKTLRTADLTGCWLFATLEPCGPGTRKFPKICCAERIANARIEKVWYGVQELNPNAKGGNEYLKKREVDVFPFDPDLHHIIKEYNKTFHDWVDSERAKNEIAATINTGFLQAIVTNADISSLSKDALELYLNRTGKSYNYDSPELIQDLIDKNLLEVNEKTKEVHPTGNCILLFGNNPRDKFPQSAVKVKVDYGTSDEQDTESFNDPIVLIPDKVQQWVKKVLPESMDRSGIKLEKVSHFPLAVIREAVINAIIHRDYSIKGAKIELIISPTMVEVRSPGAPISPNSLEDLQRFTAVSHTRNPDLAYIFNLIGYMEETGIGMDTFKAMREKYQLPLPVFRFDGVNTIVTFPRTSEAITEFLQKDILKELNRDELIAFEIFRDHRPISKNDFAIQTGLSKRSAERLLKKFVDLTLIKKLGAGPSTNYTLND